MRSVHTAEVPFVFGTTAAAAACVLDHMHVRQGVGGQRAGGCKGSGQNEELTTGEGSHGAFLKGPVAKG